MPFKTGRNASPFEIPKLRMSNYRGVLPTPPESVDYADAADKTLRNVYLNDQLGCCVVSAGAHTRGVTSGNSTVAATDEVEFSDNDIRKMYKIIGGGGDNGADPATALRYWTKTGFTDNVKLMGWLAVDPTDPQEYRTALWLFENLYVACFCPDRWLNPLPQGDDFVWDVAGKPVMRNGHAWMACGYDDKGLRICTWGLLGLQTDAAVARYCTRSAGGELYVLVSPDMIAEAQTKAPNGMNWHELISDFNTLGGNLPVPPELKEQTISWADTF